MLRVFLVEDESIIREMLRDTVPWDQLGYQFVGEAGDGEMALPLIRQRKPDVLITDIRMPFMDGLALSRLVLQEFPAMKIIILSGYDDFEYARQAIGIGVERYLLKPVTKSALMEVLTQVRDKLEEELDRQNYQERFRQEAQEYEQYARRRFVERVVSGQLTVQQIYEEAAGLDLDLRAQSYNLAFFSTPPEGPGAAGYSEQAARVRDALLEYFLKRPEYVLLRWNLNAYLLLILGDAERMEGLSRACVEQVKGQYEALEEGVGWYVALGQPTPRLSALPACFEEVSRLWACRYLLPRQHLLTSQTVGELPGQSDEADLSHIDPARVNPNILLGVLQSAGVEEVEGFVEEYLHSLSEGLRSQPFCQFLMLQARFTAVGYVSGTLGVDQQAFLGQLDCLDLVGKSVTPEELRGFLTQVLLQAVLLRENASTTQGKGLLKQAMAYIDSHFTDEDLSLNRVAREINLSANYLSAVFSQETGATFTEYVTSKRMERARELLRTTDKRSGEVAFAVGYRDPHYFSFLFKKTQGCTPRDYRANGGRRP